MPTLLEDLLVRFWIEGMLFLIAYLAMAREVLSGIYKDVYRDKIESLHSRDVEFVLFMVTILILVWLVESGLKPLTPSIMDVTVDLVVALMLSFAITNLFFSALVTLYYFLWHVSHRWLWH